ncbi:hypothetical protein LOK49_LG01G02350 [Camellia lanceoleosa]|uniref:Uncharacterized protein n=1 Tax=Camellia lanceoleosa TaxID=1840588 RepID=A0ACC0J095_9ERIC|nr:hypothetical protein LOK49_LG01G02350 [Camellia lanceoleosa]
MECSVGVVSASIGFPGGGMECSGPVGLWEVGVAGARGGMVGSGVVVAERCWALGVGATRCGGFGSWSLQRCGFGERGSLIRCSSGLVLAALGVMVLF